MDFKRNMARKASLTCRSLKGPSSAPPSASRSPVCARSPRLNLGDRAHTGDREADGGADDGPFSERHVNDAFLAIFLLKSIRRAKHATESADVLAQHDHAFVARERFI